MAIWLGLVQADGSGLIPVRRAHLETVKPSPADWTPKVFTGTAVAGRILDGTSNALE
jgi:hypothetical protein